MKIYLIGIILLFSTSSFSQEVVVNVSLHPAGSFKVKTSEISGAVIKNGDDFEANNLLVDLRNIQTGISLRDEHTKKHLEVEKFPQAILVSAKGHAGQGQGVIRIKGIEQKIQGTFETSEGKLVAHFPLKLSDFKIDGVKYMGVGVDDNVTVDITVPIKTDSQGPKTK